MRIISTMESKFSGAEWVNIDEWLHRLEFFVKRHNLTSQARACGLVNSVKGRAFNVLLSMTLPTSRSLSKSSLMNSDHLELTTKLFRNSLLQSKGSSRRCLVSIITWARKWIEWTKWHMRRKSMQDLIGLSKWRMKSRTRSFLFFNKTWLSLCSWMA